MLGLSRRRDWGFEDACFLRREGDALGDAEGEEWESGGDAGPLFAGSISAGETVQLDDSAKIYNWNSTAMFDQLSVYQHPDWLLRWWVVIGGYARRLGFPATPPSRPSVIFETTFQHPHCQRHITFAPSSFTTFLLE